jgi:hypothetical protein
MKLNYNNFNIKIIYNLQFLYELLSKITSIRSLKRIARSKLIDLLTIYHGDSRVGVLGS